MIKYIFVVNVVEPLAIENKQFIAASFLNIKRIIARSFFFFCVNNKSFQNIENPLTTIEIGFLVFSFWLKKSNSIFLTNYNSVQIQKNEKWWKNNNFYILLCHPRFIAGNVSCSFHQCDKDKLLQYFGWLQTEEKMTNMIEIDKKNAKLNWSLRKTAAHVPWNDFWCLCAAITQKPIGRLAKKWFFFVFL